MLPNGFEYFDTDNQGNALPASGALLVQSSAVTNLWGSFTQVSHFFTAGSPAPTLEGYFRGLPYFRVQSNGYNWHGVRCAPVAITGQTRFSIACKQADTANVRMFAYNSTKLLTSAMLFTLGSDATLLVQNAGNIAYIGRESLSDGWWLYTFTFTPLHDGDLHLINVGADTTTVGHGILFQTPMWWQGSPDAPLVEGTMAAANPVPKYDAAVGKDVVVDYLESDGTAASKTVEAWNGEITGTALGITEPFQVQRLEVYEPGEAP